MSLDNIIRVTISRNTTYPSRVGFGTPLIAAYFPTSVFPERVKSFSSLTELTDEGFKTTDPVYKIATDLLSQNPSVGTFKVGRRDGAPDQVIQITPLAPVVGEVHTVTVTGYADSAFASRAEVTDTYSLTITTETDQEDIVDDFVANMTETGDYTLSKSGVGSAAKLLVTANNTTMSGLLFEVTVSKDTMYVDDITSVASPTINTDLSTINTYDSDWYAFVIDSNSKEDIVGPTPYTAGAAAWAEANKKFFAYQTQDYNVAALPDAADSATIAHHAKINEYDRTLGFFHRNNFDNVAAAMLGRALPTTPGSITWAYKQLNSIAAQDLNTSELTNLMGTFDSPGGKFVNAYIDLRSISHTRFGTVASGEFADVIRGTDWLSARIQEDIYAALIQNDKLPLTDAGINVVRQIIQARLDEGVSNGFLSPTPEPSVEVPRASSLSAADKAARKLTGVKFRATLAGAIHYTAIEGELNL